MTYFQGHAFAGSITLFFGLWWAVKSSLMFFSQTAKTSLVPKRVIYWLEFLVWIAFLSTSFLGIILGHFEKPGGPGLHLYSAEEHKWISLHVWQHSTMYLFFGMAALVSLLTVAHFEIPLGLDRLMLSLALFNEGINFYFHIAHRPPLDYHLHFMMLFAIFSAAFGCLLEVCFRENPILEMFRASMFLTQGTWMWQIGFVLYPPWGPSTWDQNDHENIMFITMCFSWHYAASLLLMSVIYSIIYCLFKQLGRKNRNSATEIEQFNQARDTFPLLVNDADED